MGRFLGAMVFGILVAGMAAMHTGCTYNNEEDLYPYTPFCDTTSATLNAVAKPILQGNCYSCHSASSAGASGAGINLEDYGSLRGWAVNGRLMLAMEHTGCCPMPKGQPKLPECDIAKIKAWVNRGAQND